MKIRGIIKGKKNYEDGTFEILIEGSEGGYALLSREGKYISFSKEEALNFLGIKLN